MRPMGKIWVIVMFEWMIEIYAYDHSESLPTQVVWIEHILNITKMICDDDIQREIDRERNKLGEYKNSLK